MESADGCVEVKEERRDTSACTFSVYMHTSTLSEDTHEHITTNTHTHTHTIILDHKVRIGCKRYTAVCKII